MKIPVDTEVRCQFQDRTPPDELPADEQRTDNAAKCLVEVSKIVRLNTSKSVSGRNRASQTPIGLLAGSGRFPILFARAAKRQGLPVACVGLKYEASEELRGLCDTFDVVGISKLGGMIRTFRRRGAERVVMAGKVTKSVMYTPWRFLQLTPDLRMIHFWYHRLSRDKRDDSILLGVIAEFERDGLTFDSALDYCPELLVTKGILTRRRPTSAEMKDVEFGWQLAKEMGRLDVGQSVAVKERAALAVEAIEGTDRCIERAGQLCRAGAWTLVKVAKPQQDMRFDVPTIGTTTIENLHRAGARVLAIEADKTIVVDQPEVVALADRYGLVIVAIDPVEIAA
jgi:UDP-2,3-diacylglucosamine hydrolase